MNGLTMGGTEFPLPEELPEPVPFGDFGKGVRRVTLAHSLYAPFRCHLFNFFDLGGPATNDVDLTVFRNVLVYLRPMRFLGLNSVNVAVSPPRAHRYCLFTNERGRNAQAECGQNYIDQFLGDVPHS